MRKSIVMTIDLIFIASRRYPEGSIDKPLIDSLNDMSLAGISSSLNIQTPYSGPSSDIVYSYAGLEIYILILQR